MDPTTIRVVLNKIAEVRADKVHLLSTSMASDYAEYAKKMGYLQALDELTSIIDAAASDYVRNN